MALTRTKKMFYAAMGVVSAAMLYEGGRWVASEKIEADIGPYTLIKEKNTVQDITIFWLNHYHEGQMDWTRSCEVKKSGIECNYYGYSTR